MANAEAVAALVKLKDFVKSMSLAAVYVSKLIPGTDTAWVLFVTKSILNMSNKVQTTADPEFVDFCCLQAIYHQIAPIADRYTDSEDKNLAQSLAAARNATAAAMRFISKIVFPQPENSVSNESEPVQQH